MHIGTADVGVSIRRVADTDGFVIAAATRVPAAMGDRFILRDSGRKAVVGGGRILDPNPAPRPRPEDVRTLQSVVDDEPDARASALLTIRAVGDTEQLGLDSAGGVASGGIAAGPKIVSQAEADRISVEMHAIVGRYHTDYPLRPGIGRGQLATKLRVGDEVIAAIVESDPSFSNTEGAIAAGGFIHRISDADEILWNNTRHELETSFAVPRLSAIELREELLHAIVRRGDLVQIDDDLAFTEQQIAHIRETARALPDGFTVAEFKDSLGMSRRQAVPTLEWLDRTGVTVRSGNGRVAR
jgi:selenocysteine-specific elongation factor